MKIKTGIEIDSGTTRQLNFRVANRIQDCDLDLWEQVTKHAPLFMKIPFLQAFEEALPDTLQTRYGILSDKEIPVVVFVGQILVLHADRIPSASPSADNPRTKKILQSVMSKLHTRVFMWGNFMGWGYSGIAFAPGVDRAALWPKVAEAIDRAQEADEGISSAGIQLVLDISDDEEAGASHLERHRFRSMPAEPDMILTIDPGWKTFEDYRAALKAKYRKASVEMDKELAIAGCVIEKLSDVETHADELINLHLQVHEQSPNRFVTLKRDFIPALARRLGDRFICTVIRQKIGQESRILGFITTLIDGDTALAYVVGHDVQANRNLPIYLRLLQTAIEDGIRHGCKRVTYGRTALEPKARLGAIPIPLTVYGRHKNAIVGALATPFLQQMAPKNGPPLRSPFKETSALPTQAAQVQD
jgi:predicted N-acyltransferase